MKFNFEWNPEKARQNYKKHGISFERAVSVFQDPLAISVVDQEHSDSEERWITIGKDRQEILIVISHLFKQIDVETHLLRIISARKATLTEAKQYAELKL